MEDLVLTAVNRAIGQADNLNNIEMANATRGMFPGM
jgi:DNA-binding protein YbaB